MALPSNTSSVVRQARVKQRAKSRPRYPKGPRRRDQRPTAFGTASTFSNDPKLFRSILQTIAELPINVLATIGSDVGPPSQALRDVLGEPKHRVNAQQIADEIATMPPPSEIVDSLARECGVGG